jgi:hypothetical protein
MSNDFLETAGEALKTLSDMYGRFAAVWTMLGETCDDDGRPSTTTRASQPRVSYRSSGASRSRRHSDKPPSKPSTRAS